MAVDSFSKHKYKHFLHVTLLEFVKNEGSKKIKKMQKKYLAIVLSVFFFPQFLGVCTWRSLSTGFKGL